MSAKKTPKRPATFPAKVRTTVTPLEVVEVTEREFDDLDAQGLIFDGTLADAKAATTPGGNIATDPTSQDQGGNASGSDDKKEA